MRYVLLTLCCAVTAGVAAATVTTPVSYEVDGLACEGVLVYDDAAPTPLPAVLMVPNWMGVTDNAVDKATFLAGRDYAVFIADMYGVDTRPQNSDEASEAAGAVRADRPMMRRRVNAALDVFLARDDVALDHDRVAAIGFCFGGGTVLELARSGRHLDAVVSFHGDLKTSHPAAEGAIATSILVCHGASDPHVPPEHVIAFGEEMTAAGADWQMLAFGGAVHSFTNPDADTAGSSDYDAIAAQRAFSAMHTFFAERFQASGAQ